MADKPKALVSAEERATVARAVCTWLNCCPILPVERVEYEYLEASGLALSKNQTAYKSKQYIDGSYQAQFVFSLVYRMATSSADERLRMDELLTQIAEWCEAGVPNLESPMLALSVRCSEDAVMIARYDDGSEDHQITLIFTYEVNIYG